MAELAPLIPVPMRVKKAKHKKQKSKKKKEKYRLHSGHLEVVWKKQVPVGENVSSVGG